MRVVAVRAVWSSRRVALLLPLLLPPSGLGRVIVRWPGLLLLLLVVVLWWRPATAPRSEAAVRVAAAAVAAVVVAVRQLPHGAVERQLLAHLHMPRTLGRKGGRQAALQTGRQVGWQAGWQRDRQVGWQAGR